MALGRSEGTISFEIGIVHMLWDVIKEQSEVRASQRYHLLKPLLEMSQFDRLAVTDIQAGTQGVNKVDLPLFAVLKQFSEFQRFGGGIRLAPERALLQIVLRSVEIGVQTPAGHPIEKLESFLVRPGLAVKAFDNSRQKVGFVMH